MDGAMSDASPRPHLRLKPLFPIVSCWVFMMFATALASLVLAIRWQGNFGDTLAVGIYLGQFGLAAIVGGLIGRTWIYGWLFSVALVCIATFVAWIPAEIAGRGSLNDRLMLCCFWPVLMLAACGPLVIMRELRGWRLTLEDRVAIPRESSRAEDIFLLSVIVASCICLIQLMQKLEFVPISQLSFVAGLFSGYSLLFVVPATAATFRVRNWGIRIVCWLAIAIAVMLACLVVTYSMSQTNLLRNLADILVGTTAGAIVMMIGGVTLLASGVKLTHFEPATKAELAPKGTDFDLAQDEDHWLEPQPKPAQPGRRQARILAACVGLAAGLAMLVIGVFDAKRSRFYQEIQATPNVTDVTTRDQAVVAVTLAPTATDADLANLRDGFGRIERLSLAGTQTTDAAIEKLAYFPLLQHLDLSNTSITNAGLAQLASVRGLKSLSVANTQVDLKNVLELVNQLELAELDLSGLRLTDQDLEDVVFDGHSLTSIKLSQNPISDIGLASLLQNYGFLTSLDVSDTAIDGTGLLNSRCPDSVNLDGTNVTDAKLRALLTKRQCSRVSIRRTKISAGILPTLADGTMSLSLGEGLITERDLAGLRGAAFRHLSLNDKKFSGEFLGEGHVSVQTLDLSHSGVTDAALKTLGRNRLYRMYLDLSHTAITDSGLPYIYAHEVDLRHTMVTADGLLNAPMPADRVLIDHNQFTPRQLVLLNDRKFIIDGESEYGR